MILSLALFFLALEFMKVGARTLEPLLRQRLQVSGVLDGMGFGWLSAAGILSGSPIAAMSLALLDVGAVDKLTAFGMINGSRIGAPTMVLLLGFVYMRRGANKQAGLAVGLMSLLVSQTVQLPAILIGALLLQSKQLDGVHLTSAQQMTSGIGMLTEPFTTAAARHIPNGMLFFVGLAMITVSFRMFDRVVPHPHPHNEPSHRLQRMLAHPLSLFALGLVVTFFTLSVSISLGLLVPLTARKIVRREHLIPYIMGAGISTFVDTFTVALLLQNAQAITVVLVEMVTITLISLAYIGIGFQWYERTVLRATDYLLDHSRAMWVYLGAFVLIPLLLIVS